MRKMLSVIFSIERYAKRLGAIGLFGRRFISCLLSLLLIDKAIPVPVSELVHRDYAH